MEHDSPCSSPVISLSNVALKDPLLPLHPPGDSLSHPGKQDRAARAPPCVCQWFVPGGGEPSSLRRMACQSCACQAGKGLWQVFNRVLFHRSSKRVGPGRAWKVAHRGGLWALWHGSTHTPFRTHIRICTHTPWDIHIQYSCIPLHTTPLRCGQIPPPHVRAGTPDRNESLAPKEDGNSGPQERVPGPDPAKGSRREPRAHRRKWPADMMTQLKAGRGWESWCRRRSVARLWPV